MPVNSLMSDAVGAERGPFEISHRGSSLWPCFMLFSFLCCMASLGSQFQDKRSEIPPFKPPLKEMPPTFWEAHGTKVVGASAAFGVVAALALVWFRRTRPVPQVSPEQTARQALGLIRSSSPVDLSAVSQVTRRCLASMFTLPAWEMTTSEFCGALDLNAQSRGPALTSFATDVRAFLERCDRAKFTPGPIPGGSQSDVDEALRLVDKGAALTAPPVEPAKAA